MHSHIIYIHAEIYQNDHLPVIYLYLIFMYHLSVNFHIRSLEKKFDKILIIIKIIIMQNNHTNFFTFP